MSVLTRVALLVACAFSTASFSSAAVINFADYTKTTDGNQPFSGLYNNDGTLGQSDPASFSIDEGDAYMLFSLTFSGNSGVLDTTEAFGGWSHSGGDIFGQRWEQSVAGIDYYGGANSSTPIVAGTPVTYVVKYKLAEAGTADDGDKNQVDIWINPDLNALESTQTPTFADRGKWNRGEITANYFQYRMGNLHANDLQFTNVGLYYAGDTPFVPEPSSLALSAIAVLSVVGFGTRRRKK